MATKWTSKSGRAHLGRHATGSYDVLDADWHVGEPTDRGGNVWFDLRAHVICVEICKGTNAIFNRCCALNTAFDVIACSETSLCHGCYGINQTQLVAICASVGKSLTQRLFAALATTLLLGFALKTTLDSLRFRVGLTKHHWERAFQMRPLAMLKMAAHLDQ